MVSARLPRLLLVLLAWLSPLAATAAAAAAPAASTVTTREYTLAVIPIMPPAEVKRRWQPLLDEITRASGLRFRFHFAKDYAAFERSLAAGEVDFAVASPVLIWQQRERYRPILRGKLGLTGQVVVRHDSPVRQLADLEGRTLAFQDGSSLTTNVLLLRALREQKVAFVPQPVNTESSALRSVVLGKHDAALVNNYLMLLVPPGIVPRLRIIHSTPEAPPPAILASRACPPEVSQRFRDAVMALRDSRPALLGSILMADMVDADLERDYGVMARQALPEPAGGRP